MKCQCGLEIYPNPPAVWIGNTEYGQPVIRFNCKRGHHIDVQLATIKPFAADRSSKYPPTRGEYFKGAGANDAFQFCCPICKCLFGMAAHRVMDDGNVEPSIVCPAGCGFHAEVSFKDWKP